MRDRTHDRIHLSAAAGARHRNGDAAIALCGRSQDWVATLGIAGSRLSVTTTWPHRSDSIGSTTALMVVAASLHSATRRCGGRVGGTAWRSATTRQRHTRICSENRDTARPS
jgi:hypothetical protein